MRVRRTLVGAVAVIGLLAVASTSVSASPPTPEAPEHPCKVGGPPAWYFWRVPPGVKGLSPIVTIACGRRLLGKPYEIVAVDTNGGLSVYADSGPLGFSEGLPVPSGGPFGAITVQSSWSGPPVRSYVYGVLGASVARVKVIFHHRGQGKRVVRVPTTALVTGELLTELHQTEPFGAYAMTVSGCLPPNGIRVVAFDAQGQRVGSERGRAFIAHFCNPKA